MTKISRGQVWTVNLDPQVGAEMKKARPCVVVSSDQVGALPLKIVVPITKWQEAFQGCSWMVKIDPSQSNGLSDPSAADAFQVKSLSLERFVNLRGVLTSDQVDDIVAAVAIVIEVL